MFYKGNLKNLSHIVQLEDLLDSMEKNYSLFAKLSQHSLTYKQTIAVSE